jgi:hypothetical protein
VYFKMVRLWCCALNGAFVHVVDEVGGSVHPADSNGSDGNDEGNKVHSQYQTI